MELLTCFCRLCWEHISQIVSFSTPVILLIWFCYSQYQLYLKNYCSEIAGIYAGFPKLDEKIKDGNRKHTGLILKICDVDSKGYFRGEFSYGKIAINDQFKISPLLSGKHVFFGKLNYCFHFDKKRHPLKVKENRAYIGKLYIIDRLDFQFETKKMDQYIQMEYSITHYRELKSMKFSILVNHRKESSELPNDFILYKSIGLTNEPLQWAQRIIKESYNA
jgi:hypothetical protein